MWGRRRGRHGSWIYNYLCNQCKSPLKVWVRIPLMARCTIDTILCDKVCRWSLTADWRFSPSIPVSSTNKTYRHDITEILLKVTLSTILYIFKFDFWLYVMQTTMMEITVTIFPPQGYVVNNITIEKRMYPIQVLQKNNN